MKTDDEITELFAAANPRPTRSGRSSTGVIGRPLSSDPDQIVLDEISVLSDPVQAPRRRWVILAAAALVVVVGGLGAIALINDASNPEAEPTADERPTTTRSTLPDADIPAPQIIRDFVTAFNERDIAAMEATVGPEYSVSTFDPIDGTGDFTPARRAWYDAFEWQWEIVDDCQRVAAAVTCVLETHNRLTEYTGATLPTTARFTFVGDRIARISVLNSFGRGYSETAFEPFYWWVMSTHPEDEDVIWGDPTTFESAQRLDARLTEFTAEPEPPDTPIQAFLDARARGDSEAIVDLLAPDAIIDDLWAHAPSDYAAMSAAVDATDWVWDPRSCRPVDRELPAIRFVCYVRPMSIWTESAAALPTSVRLEIDLLDGRITAVRSSLTAEKFDTALAPWYEWLRTEYPGDLEAIFDDTTSGLVPRDTPEALALLESRSREWVESTAD